MTHDYKRHGTTTLFAALDVLTGRVIGQRGAAGSPRPRMGMLEHRAVDFVRFLRRIDKTTPPELDLHLILDNGACPPAPLRGDRGAAHKAPPVKRWLERHPRFHLHFTPTSASWANAVEGFFSQLTTKRLKRGAFQSVIELHRAVDAYLQQHNAEPKPFVWTKPVDPILHKVNRAKQTLESMQ